MRLPDNIEFILKPGKISNPQYLIRTKLERMYPHENIQVFHDGSFFLREWPYYFGKKSNKEIERMWEEKIVTQEIILKAYKI